MYIVISSIYVPITYLYFYFTLQHSMRTHPTSPATTAHHSQARSYSGSKAYSDAANKQTCVPSIDSRPHAQPPNHRKPNPDARQAPRLSSESAHRAYFALVYLKSEFYLQKESTKCFPIYTYLYVQFKKKQKNSPILPPNATPPPG